MAWWYNLGIHLLGIAMRLAAIFSHKARLWVDGRKHSYDAMDKLNRDKSTIWVHASSLGEFEQGKYLIQQLKHVYPDHQIALSFYSPSGYEAKKNWSFADSIFYIPLDTRKNARATISHLRPEMIIFIKYDFWWNHLSEAIRREIPVYFVSATFRSDQYFIKSNSAFFRNVLSGINHFFVQDAKSAEILDQINIKQYTVIGDTRLDSVLNEPSPNSAVAEVLSNLSQSKGDKLCAIYGSVHLADMPIISSFIAQQRDIFHIVFPHELNPSNIADIKNHLASAHSQSTEQDHISIVDSLGVLKHSYAMADLVYIGGGFGDGIHNTLEPLVHLQPIIIGPKYQKFPEAVHLVQTQGITCISTPNEFEKQADLLINAEQSDVIDNQRSYISENKGATEKLISHFRRHITTEK